MRAGDLSFGRDPGQDLQGEGLAQDPGDLRARPAG